MALLAKIADRRGRSGLFAVARSTAIWGRSARGRPRKIGVRIARTAAYGASREDYRATPDSEPRFERDNPLAEAARER